MAIMSTQQPVIIGEVVSNHTTQAGSLRVTAPCVPTQVVLDGAGFVLNCRGTLTNRTASPVVVSYQAVTTTGANVGTTHQATLAPGQSLVLPPLPSSATGWLIVDLSHGQADAIAAEVLAALAVVGGLAVYGTIALIRGLRHRRRHR